MIPNEDQFDDFKVPETAAYVNDAIGRVFEKELTEEVSELRLGLHNVT